MGSSKKLLDAVIIVALLQALQGSKQRADWLTDHGYGKAVEAIKLIDDAANPIALDGMLTVIPALPL